MSTQIIHITMEDKEKEIIDTEDHEQPTPGVDIDAVHTSVRKAANKKLEEELIRYGADKYLETKEADDDKKFDRVITTNTVKQWMFTVFTIIIVALAIADIAFGFGKVDKWVYLFGVITAYEANEAREKKNITEEYKESRKNTRKIIESTLRFKHRLED